MDKLREKIAEIIDDYAISFKDALVSEPVKKILSLIKEAGYVQLDPNQELPIVTANLTGTSAYHNGFYAGSIKAQQDMKRQGFKKVIDG